MQRNPWDQTTFRAWLIARISEILGEDSPMLDVGRRGRRRELTEEDFGLDKKTLAKWETDSLDDSFPAGKKVGDIVQSDGFRFLTNKEKIALLALWIDLELVQQNHPISDELVELVITMMENSRPEFLLECLAKIAT